MLFGIKHIKHICVQYSILLFSAMAKLIREMIPLLIAEINSRENILSRYEQFGAANKCEFYASFSNKAKSSRAKLKRTSISVMTPNMRHSSQYNSL